MNEEYYLNGQIIKETKHHTSEFYEEVEYFPCGIIKSKCFYLRNNKHGIEEYRNTTNEIIQKRIYNRGICTYLKTIFHFYGLCVINEYKHNISTQKREIKKYINNKLCELSNLISKDEILTSVYSSQEEFDKNSLTSYDYKTNDYTFDNYLKKILPIVDIFSYFKNATITQNTYVDDVLRKKVVAKTGKIREITHYHKNGKLFSTIYSTKRGNKYSGNENRNEFFTYDENGNIESHYFLKKNELHGNCYYKDSENEYDGEFEFGKLIDGTLKSKHTKLEIKEETIKNENGKTIYNCQVMNNYKLEIYYYYLKNDVLTKSIKTDLNDKIIHMSLDMKTYQGKQTTLKIISSNEYNGDLCKLCFDNKIDDVFNKGLSVCKYNFMELEENCPYYLEHIALKNNDI